MKVTHTILLIHKIPIIRKGIRTILERDDNQHFLIYEMDNFWDAQDIILSGNCNALILDRDATRLLYSETKVKLPHLMVYDQFDSETFDMLRVGGNCGFIPLNSGCDIFLKALATILRGETYFVEGMFEVKSPLVKKDVLDIDFDNLLTKREQQILDMVLAELTHDEMAERLNVSRRTVEGHKHNLTRKLNVKSLIGLTRLAIESGRIK